MRLRASPIRAGHPRYSRLDLYRDYFWAGLLGETHEVLEEEFGEPANHHLRTDPPTRLGKSSMRGNDVAIEIRLDQISDEKLLALSEANPGYRFERSREGKLIVSPTSLFPSGGEGELYVQVYNWTKRTKLGRAFPATGGFTLPDTAIKAADTSYFTNERLAGTESSQDAFPLIAPSVAFELMSSTDDLKTSMANVAKYITNGTDLGVLITTTPSVLLLRPGANDWVTHTTPLVEIGPEMLGSELDVNEIIHAQRKGV